MKTSLLLLAFGFAAVLAFPVEETAEEQWEMIPDADGSFHLVNIKDLEFQAAIANRAEFPVRFYLYTKSNPTSGQEIVTGNVGSLTGSYFSASRQTRIITHGWRNDASSPVGSIIRNAYLARGDYNCIIVDWSQGASSLNYATAKANVVDAGKKVAAFLNFLNSHGTSSNNIYLIGHSLGAHVSGFAGKYANTRPNTIFGLDAALPLFNINDPNGRLSSGDAGYVESIHTDCGRLGFDQPIGESSYYPNGGGVQPGCGVDLTGSCSHSRAYEYFAESLKANNEFIGQKCPNLSDATKNKCSGGSTSRMGGDPSNRAIAGLYYVPVNSKVPFATGRV